MSYKITLKKSVARDLKKIHKNHVLTILNKIENDLPEIADTCPILTGKFSGLRKLRAGDYRIIFAIVGITVLILRICHRKDVYR